MFDHDFALLNFVCDEDVLHFDMFGPFATGYLPLLLEKNCAFAILVDINMDHIVPLCLDKI